MGYHVLDHNCGFRGPLLNPPRQIRLRFLRLKDRATRRHREASSTRPVPWLLLTLITYLLAAGVMATYVL